MEYKRRLPEDNTWEVDTLHSKEKLVVIQAVFDNDESAEYNKSADIHPPAARGEPHIPIMLAVQNL